MIGVVSLRGRKNSVKQGRRDGDEISGSRSARPEKALGWTAQWKINQLPSLERNERVGDQRQSEAGQCIVTDRL